MMIQPEGQAPYAPPAAVLDVITRYRNHGLTVPFTTDVLERAGVTPSLAPRTLQAFKLLDLVDADGHPTALLDGLERARSDEFEDRLRAVVTGVYADVFAFADPENDTVERIEDAFRSYQPKGQRGRMVTLFLGLCAAAGMKTPTATRTRSGEDKGRGTTRRSIPQPTASKKKAARTHITRPAPGRGGGDELPPAVQGLLDSLPDSGLGWTREDRDRFLATFAAVLDFAYPVRTKAAATTPPEDDS